MKKPILILLICVMAASLLAPSLGAADYYVEPLLISLQHNCRNTGRMLPEYFDPNTDAYILTVASWVTNIKFTMTAADPACSITVNGTYVPQGVETQVATMNDQPQQLQIRVSAPGGAYRDYTVFLQRRPSERRTRVSAGFINSINFKSNKWYIDADLVTLSFQDGNVSTYSNKTKEVNKYNYACTANCVFYAGSMANPVRARNMNEFMSMYDPGAIYRLVYIEDEIVAVLPYSPDY